MGFEPIKITIFKIVAFTCFATVPFSLKMVRGAGLEPAKLAF